MKQGEGQSIYRCTGTARATRWHGLPGMVVKIGPLTPTRMSLLEDFATDDNKVFTLNNLNQSEAFSIKLESAGSSEGLNLERLYTLGIVSSS